MLPITYKVQSLFMSSQMASTHALIGLWPMECQVQRGT